MAIKNNPAILYEMIYLLYSQKKIFEGGLRR
jgi:hypothetical protein